ncbi:MAG: CCA tRNA nucleotidyltransferase [Acidobacteria bacterium]|nr:CCA tRNA nucleotidyltransferase [Acidobacteriota bacterium]
MRDPLLTRLWPILEPGPVWVTGGYVRDRLLGRTSNDIDLIAPGDLMELQPLAERLAASLGVRAHVLGRPPKAVWNIASSGLKIDLWPLADGSLTADALRRDLTINALIARLPGGELIDPAGGLRDLEQRRLRAISPENLRRDPVRLLRIARFASELPGFTLDPQTHGWITALAPGLGKSPHERLGAELLLLLRATAPQVGLSLIDQTGMAPFVFPVRAGSAPTRLARYLLPAARLLNAPRKHPVPGALREAGDAARLGLLFFFFGMTRPSCCRDYGWPKEARRHGLVAALSLAAALHASTQSAAARRLFISRCGESFPAVFAVASALARTCGLPVRPWRRWWRQWQRNAVALLHPRPLLAAKEVATLLDIPPGPQLGRTLQALKDAQILGRIRSPAAARAFLTRLQSDPLPKRGSSTP